MTKYLTYNILLLFLFSITVFAQDDTEEKVKGAELFAEQELIKEKHYLNFKKSFIESLQQKGIENYDKALGSLSVCEAIYPDNVPMLFESAKNHYHLKQYIEAHHYCDKALSLKPNDFWILALSRDVYEKEHNYTEAIKIQKKLYTAKNSEAGNLLKLYYRSKKIKEGQKLLAEIESKNIYVLALDFYKRKFKVKEDVVEKQPKKEGNSNNKDLSFLKEEFSKTNDYKILQQILEKEALAEQYKDLLKDSNSGLALFPAQAHIYLYNGLALNGLKKYTEAVIVLETGLDFVFDNPSLTKQFYSELIIGYSKINKTDKANHYKRMVQKLQP